MFVVRDIIEDVRNSGFGIYIGSVFLGCILYTDDILLLSGSCTGLQYMVMSVSNTGDSGTSSSTHLKPNL